MEDVAARTLGRVAANDIELAYETFGDAADTKALKVVIRR